jgi:ABC-type transport system substrate-binding protein
VTRDNRVWAFSLRQGVRFHDGTPLDADAVLANAEHLRRELGLAAQVDRVGPHAIQITLERPNAALLATLSQPFFALQSPAALGAHGRPVGTGAFRFVSAQPGLVELAANPEHWAGAPRLRRLLFRRYPSEQALAAALQSGAVDITTSIGQARVAGLRGQPGLTLDSKTGLNLVYLALNNERPPFSDRRLREAVARAVDRRGLIEEYLGGHGEPARNPLPPSVPGYATGTKELRHDTQGARRLLADSGHPNGIDVRFLAPETPRPYLPNPLPLVARIRRELAEAGIRTTLETVAGWSDYLERLVRGDFAIAVIGWQADSLDPNDFLTALLGSESVGTSNRSRYRSSAMDDLLHRARTSPTRETRLAAYREVQALFQRDMPFAPLFHASVFAAYTRSLNGVIVAPTGLLRYEKAWKAQP